MLTSDGKQSLNIGSHGKVVYSDLRIDLLGIYQRLNVPTVLRTIDVLNENGWNLTEEIIRRGLANTIQNTALMGRWQIIGHNPLTICDTGHNPAGIQLVVEQINQTAWEKLHIVIGMVNDKDQREVLSLLPTHATYYFTKANIPRATEPQELAAKAAMFGLMGNSYPSVRQALSEALANAGTKDLVFVGGSTFVVAEIL
jgi:dihydrofolate synthase/folylpolyglutamate synthase